MEKRLIDAKAFDLRLSQKKITEVFPDWKKLPQEVREAVCKYAQHFHMLLETQPTVDLETQPTEDTVKVVRCRDCRMFVDNKEALVTYCRRCLADLTVNPDDFCSYGERRTDGKL